MFFSIKNVCNSEEHEKFLNISNSCLLLPRATTEHYKYEYVENFSYTSNLRHDFTSLLKEILKIKIYVNMRLFIQ